MKLLNGSCSRFHHLFGNSFGEKLRENLRMPFCLWSALKYMLKYLLHQALFLIAGNREVFIGKIFRPVRLCPVDDIVMRLHLFHQYQSTSK